MAKIDLVITECIAAIISDFQMFQKLFLFIYNFRGMRSKKCSILVCLDHFMTVSAKISFLEKNMQKTLKNQIKRLENVQKMQFFLHF